MNNAFKFVLGAFSMLWLLASPQVRADVITVGDVETFDDYFEDYFFLFIGYTNYGSITVTANSVYEPNRDTTLGASVGASHSSITVQGANAVYAGGVNVGAQGGEDSPPGPPYGSFNTITVSGGGGFQGGIQIGGSFSDTFSNSVLVTDPGSYLLGSIGLSGSDNVFTLQNGAQVNGDANVQGFNNLVVVAGTNTVWHGAASSALDGDDILIISNGAQMYCPGGLATFYYTNTILVDGWNTILNAPVRVYGDGDQLIISRGATVICTNDGGGQTFVMTGAGATTTVTDPGTTFIVSTPALSSINSRVFINGGNVLLTISNGAQAVVWGDIYTASGGRASSNTVLVAGAGSQLILPANTIYVGGNDEFGGLSPGHQLIVAAGGVVAAADVNIYPESIVSVMGSLFVTNATGSGSLTLNGGGGGGTLNIAGNVVADTVSLQGLLYNSGDMGPGGPVFFSSGTLMTKGLGGNNNLTFIVGDGTNMANYVMQGGTHSFVNGLVIASNSVLSGCGMVTGSVTNYGLIILTNGCDMNFSGPVVNYGTILALNGTAYFNSTFTNNGTFIQTPSVTGLAFSGNDVVVQFNTVSNYLQDLQFSGDLTSGFWTTLTNGLLGTGNPMSFTDFSSLTNAQRFYRVLFHY